MTNDVGLDPTTSCQVQRSQNFIGWTNHGNASRVFRSEKHCKAPHTRGRRRFALLLSLFLIWGLKLCMHHIGAVRRTCLNATAV